MTFDRNTPWAAQARAFHVRHAGVLEIHLSYKKIKQWLEEFTMGDVLYVRFPNSDVEDWQADLTGTEEITAALGQCIQAIIRTID